MSFKEDVAKGVQDWKKEYETGGSEDKAFQVFMTSVVVALILIAILLVVAVLFALIKFVLPLVAVTGLAYLAGIRWFDLPAGPFGFLKK